VGMGAGVGTDGGATAGARGAQAINHTTTVKQSGIKAQTRRMLFTFSKNYERCDTLYTDSCTG
jgi:hypothetical protein